MQDGCKVFMDSYIASNGSCFMVTWTIFQKHLSEVGLTQNWETMALRTLTIVDLFYFIDLFYCIMCEDPHNKNPLKKHMVEGPVTCGFTLHLRVRDHVILEVFWDNLWILSFELSQFHGHNSWFVCEVTLRWILFFVHLLLIEYETCN
jgi:hypothetical protein